MIAAIFTISQQNYDSLNLSEVTTLCNLAYGLFNVIFTVFLFPTSYSWRGGGVILDVQADDALINTKK